MKIAFCGDSYCTHAQYNEPGWPFLIVEYFNNSSPTKKILQGVGGQCLFYAYQQLNKVVSMADYVILCITDPYRLPNVRRFPITLNWNESNQHDAQWPASLAFDANSMTFETRNESPDENDWVCNPPGKEKVSKAVRGYYNELMDEDFHIFVQQSILTKMDELLLEHKKKCIWFPCSDISMQGFMPKSGPIADIELFAITCGEYGYNVGDSISKRDKWREVDSKLWNHFSNENNKKLADIIINMICNNDFSAEVFELKKHFKTWEEIEEPIPENVEPIPMEFDYVNAADMWRKRMKNSL